MTQPALGVTRFRDNVWVWTFGGESIATSYGSNCTAVAGRDAVLLVDPFIAPAYAQDFAKAMTGTITGARVVLIDKAAHLPHLEQSDAVLAAVRGFLAV